MDAKTFIAITSSVLIGGALIFRNPTSGNPADPSRFEKLLVISNHPPAEQWSDNQRAGWDVSYTPFPYVPPGAGMEEVVDLALPIIDQIREWKNIHRDGKICIQGEFTLSAYLLLAVEKLWGWCFTFPTTERQVEIVVEDGKTIKKSIGFQFVRWR